MQVKPTKRKSESIKSITAKSKAKSDTQNRPPLIHSIGKLAGKLAGDEWRQALPATDFFRSLLVPAISSDSRRSQLNLLHLFLPQIPQLPSPEP